MVYLFLWGTLLVVASDAFLMNVLVCRRPSTYVGAAGEGSGGGEDGGAWPGGLHPEPQQERS